MPKDTAKYKPICCYRCGEPFRVYTFNDVWDMSIDGKLHKVPLFAVPCMRCDACDIAVIDGGSDEAIEWAYKRYIKGNGLNTPWRRFRRGLRRLWFRVYDRWNWYVLRARGWPRRVA